MTLEEDWGKSLLFCSGWRWKRGAEWPAFATIVFPTQMLVSHPYTITNTTTSHTTHPLSVNRSKSCSTPTTLQLVYFGLVTRRHSGHMWRSIKLKIHMELNFFFDATKTVKVSLLVRVQDFEFLFISAQKGVSQLRLLFLHYLQSIYLLLFVWSTLCSVSHHRFQQSRNGRGTTQQLGARGGKFSSSTDRQLTNFQLCSREKETQSSDL